MAVAANVIEFVRIDLAAKGVTVDPEGFRGARLVAVAAFQNAPDKFFLEFNNRFFEQDSALDHDSDQRFQLIFHVCTLRNGASEWASPWVQSSAWPVIR
jgi:hypothetical protein